MSLIVNAIFPFNSSFTNLPKISLRHPLKTRKSAFPPSSINLNSSASVINFSANPLFCEQYDNKSFNKSRLPLFTFNFFEYFGILGHLSGSIVCELLIIFKILFKSSFNRVFDIPLIFLIENVSLGIS